MNYIIAFCILFCFVKQCLALEEDLTKHFGLLEKYSASRDTFASDVASNFILAGAARLQNNEQVVLTPEEPKTSGGMWIKSSLPENVDQWIVQFTFSVQSKSYLGEKGLGFWYVTRPNPLVAHEINDGHFMGLGSQFEGLAIFFDSVNDKIHRYDPKISGMYLHSDETAVEPAFDFENFQQEKSFGSCFLNYRKEDVFPVEGRIIYARRTLRVEFRTPTEGATFIPCFLREDFDLPKGGFFGFTATTGEFVADVHTIHKFQVLDVALPGVDTSESKQPQPSNSESKPNTESKQQISSETIINKDHSNGAADNLEKATLLDQTSKKVLDDLKETQSHIIHSLRSLQQQLLQGFNGTENSKPIPDLQVLVQKLARNEELITTSISQNSDIVQKISSLEPSIKSVYDDVVSVHHGLEKILAQLNTLQNSQFSTQSSSKSDSESAGNNWSWSFLFASVTLQSIVFALFMAYKAKKERNMKNSKIF